MSLEERMKYAEMKTRHKQSFKPWYKKAWGIILIIILGILLIIVIASAFYVVNKIQEIEREGVQNSEIDQKIAFQKAILGTNSYYAGSASADITIVEFSDFACPFCQQSAPELKNMIAKYGDDIKVIFRDYPLHENSIELAMSARCAGEQDQFWTMHDLLFANADDLLETGPELRAKILPLAQSLDLNVSEFIGCYDDKKYLGEIKSDYDDGNILQIEGTPTWFINNYRITGYVPGDKFEELINVLLTQYGTN